MRRKCSHILLFLNKMYFVLIFILFFTNLSSKAEEIEYSPLFLCTPNLDEPYGVCSHINTKGAKFEFDTRERELSLIDSVGIQWVRTDFHWWQLQKEGEKKFRYEHYDTMMYSVEKSKKKLLGILVPPKTNTEYDGWEKYVKNVVKRYHSSVQYWEMINEADLRYQNPVWSWFTANDYVELLKKGRRIIKKRDKYGKILFSGIGNIDSGFLDSVFHSGVGEYFDIMNVHRYNPRNNEPETFLNYYGRLHTKMEKYGLNKPLWLTECGCPTANGWSSEKDQAEKLPRIFLISFALGVDKVFWYNFRSNELSPDDKECHFGLCHKDYSPKPAFYAYQNLVKMCPDKSTRPILTRKGEIYIAQWERPDGKNVYGIWTSEGKKRVSFNIEGEFTCMDIWGEKRIDIFTGIPLEISPSIIYIIGKKINIVI